MDQSVIFKESCSDCYKFQNPTRSRRDVCDFLLLFDSLDTAVKEAKDLYLVDLAG